MAEWQSELLKNITSIPKLGLPGRIIVFGEQAEPILTGEKEEDVIIAAAEYGNGRLVVFSKDSYAADMFQGDLSEDSNLALLHSNVKSWITRGSTLEDNEVQNLDETDEEKLGEARLVYWCGGKIEQSISTEALLNFIHNGGGFIHAMTPWGWMQLNNGKALRNMPYWKVLETLGICYTEEAVSDNKTEYEVTESKASGAHLLRFIKTYSEEPGNALDKAGLIRSLACVPKDSDCCLAVQTSLENAWAICSSRIQNCIPSKTRPVTTPEQRGVLDMWKVCVNMQDKFEEKAPGCDEFPGDFKCQPPTCCADVEFQSHRQEIFPTGYYAPAGKLVNVVVLDENLNHNWLLRIGAHSDVLTGGELRRWPDVHVFKPIESTTFTISSPFGGLIYLQSPDEEYSSIRLRLDDVVLAPQFNLLEGPEGVANWKERKMAPGLWADIIGKYVIFTLPSSSIREVEDPTDVMNTWDRVVCMYHELKGTDVDNCRRQWIVSDEQPSAGYMHSGYPIVTHLDVASPSHEEFVLNVENMSKCGFWGLFHEIGHNMQSSDWTFDGTTEVTCNIFTLYAMDQLCARRPWIHDWLRNNLNDAISYLNQGAEFKNWQASPGIALYIYAQMIKAFGWEAYRKVFRRYVSMSDDEKPESEQQKIDTWFKLFSEVTKCNLAPLTNFWGVPLSEEAVNTLKIYHPYLPDDEVTSAAAERTNLTLQQYPGILRSVPAA